MWISSLVLWTPSPHVWPPSVSHVREQLSRTSRNSGSFYKNATKKGVNINTVKPCETMCDVYFACKKRNINKHNGRQTLTLIMGVIAFSFVELLTSVHTGARASFAPPVSEPRISCRSSYHASNSAPHNGPTPGGYGGGRCSHSAVISPVSRNTQVPGHTVHTGPEGRGRGGNRHALYCSATCWDAVISCVLLLEDSAELFTIIKTTPTSSTPSQLLG